MTRINVVPVTELCNKHLFSEWRELPRINSYINKSLNRDFELSEIPKQYVLGSGHVKFFYNKLGWVIDRYNQLTNELHKRGYNITEGELKISAPFEFWNDWKPSLQDIELNRQRIKERMPKNPKYGSIK